MCQCATEVNPIDGPGIAVVGGIGMGCIGWNDEVLVGFYFILFAIDAVMSASLYTIDKHALVDGLRPFSIMIGSVWIVAYICDMQGPQYRV